MESGKAGILCARTKSSCSEAPWKQTSVRSVYKCRNMSEHLTWRAQFYLHSRSILHWVPRTIKCRYCPKHLPTNLKYLVGYQFPGSQWVEMALSCNCSLIGQLGTQVSRLRPFIRQKCYFPTRHACLTEVFNCWVVFPILILKTMFHVLRLTSNSLCSQRRPWNSHSPAAASWVLGLQVCIWYYVV